MRVIVVPRESVGPRGVVGVVIGSPIAPPAGWSGTHVSTFKRLRPQSFVTSHQKEYIEFTMTANNLHGRAHEAHVS
jgi:hypothetical protein